MIHQIIHGKIQSLVVVTRRHCSFDCFFVGMQPVTMGEAVSRIISYDRYPFIAVTEAGLQLHRKLKDTSTLQLEPRSQGIVFVQKAVKFNLSHALILQARGRRRQTQSRRGWDTPPALCVISLAASTPGWQTDTPRWVAEHCTAVSSSLWQSASSAPLTLPPGNRPGNAPPPNIGPSGQQQLFDCGSAQ